MPESVDAYRYLSFLGSRWRFIAVSCGIATGLALSISLVLPKKYTATCRILVEPPAGADVRGAMAVSPIYLESLKTYEHFASSDSLFVQALDQFQLRQRFPERPVEAWKAGILRVSMVRDTKILEIKVTLPDPKTAHALALYIGEETVKLSHSVSLEADRDLMGGIEKEEAGARAQVQQSEAAWSRMLAQQPMERLQQDIQSGGELKASLQRQFLRAEMDGAPPNDGSSTRNEAAQLKKQIAEIDRDLAAKEELLSRRLAERDRLDAERTASRTAYSAVETRLRQTRSDLGSRGERLRIIDPGIVPEKHSSPNVPLNVFAAILLGIIAPVVYLTLAMSFQGQRSQARRSALRVAGTGRDE
ncbi:MAG: hypothetical protein U0Q18_26460 [Bryobacteraceae bacterium]